MTFETTEEWLLARFKRLTGSKVSDVVVKRGTGQKIGFYRLIAEHIVNPGIEDLEKPMDRGQTLEPEALDRYEEMAGVKLDRTKVLWVREDNDNMAISPDATKAESNNTEAYEVKCLSSANHIKAFITQQIPEEYHYQMLQYFIVNDALEKLTFVFYDPRLRVRDLFTITITRAEVLAELEELAIYERNLLENVQAEVDKLLTF